MSAPVCPAAAGRGCRNAACRTARCRGRDRRANGDDHVDDVAARSPRAMSKTAGTIRNSTSCRLSISFPSDPARNWIGASSHVGARAQKNVGADGGSCRVRAARPAEERRGQQDVGGGNGDLQRPDEASRRAIGQPIQPGVVPRRSRSRSLRSFHSRPHSAYPLDCRQPRSG